MDAWFTTGIAVDCKKLIPVCDTCLLALAYLLRRDALLRAWDKVFPGEEKDIVPASRLCFTGIFGHCPCPV